MKTASFAFFLTAFLVALGYGGFSAVGQASHDGPLNTGYVEPPPKGTGHVLQNPGTPDGRDGGENIGDATVIPSLPYQDSGNTCDNLDDYDEICPYSSSTSPDVVYAYTPDVDILVDIDLCSEGNQYDTKLYVYCEGPGSLVACNDDFCSNSWTSYASRLEQVLLLSGFTYYIVIDGFGGDCGNYELFIEVDNVPVIVDCSEDYWVPEGEPPPTDFQPDNYNGGCNSNPPVFQLVNWNTGETDCANICGVGGTYLMPLGIYRDTDWFEVYAGSWVISGTCLSEYFTQILVSMPNPDCITNDWLIVDTFNANTVYNFSIATDPGDMHWVWIGAGDWNVDIFMYELEICGIFWDIVPTENASWGKVKNQYR